MKKDPTIREAIDESLCAVRFNAQDERNVMAAIHGRRVRAKKRARRLNLAFAAGLALDPATQLAAEAETLALTGALAPWASGSAYLNVVESESDVSCAFGARTWERLRAVRSIVDPDGLFLANHPVPGMEVDTVSC